MPYAQARRRPYTKRKAYVPKRSYKAKAPYRKRARTGTAVTNTVKRVLKRQLEKKFLDFNLQGAPPAGNNGTQVFPNKSMLVWSVTDTITGMARNQRIGDYITPVSLALKMTLPEGVPKNSVIRLTVIKVNNDNFLPVGDAIVNGNWTYTAPTLSNLGSELSVDPTKWDGIVNHVGPDRNVMIKKNITLTTGSQPGSFKQINTTVPLSGKLRYSPGNSVADQGYYVVLRIWSSKTDVDNKYLSIDGTSASSSANAASWAMQSRFTYTDA